MKKPLFSIPEPCHEDWKKMTPTEKGRFCDSCAKEVKDFSKSSDDEIAKTLMSSSAKVCGRFRKDQLTPSYPKLIDLIPTRPSYAAAVAASALALFSCDAGISQGEPMPVVGGMVAPIEAPMNIQSEHTIRGIVVDDIGEALPFATVHYLNNQGNKMGVYTDENGHFELTISPVETASQEVEIITQYVGYTSKTISTKIDEEQFLRIMLDGSDIFLTGFIISCSEPSRTQDPIRREFNRIKDWAADSKIEQRKKRREQEQSITEELQDIDLPMLGEVEVVEIIEEEELIEVEELIKPSDMARCDFTYGEESLGGHPLSSPVEAEGFVRGEIVVAPMLPREETETHAQVEEINTEVDPNPLARISEIEPDGLVLFPNPSSDHLRIESLGIDQGHYRILDVQGQELLSGYTSSFPMKITLSDFANGSYYFKLKGSDGIVRSKQFIVAR